MVRMIRPIARCAVLALLLVTLGAPAWATWSIVVVNRLTGEVAVATSTCLTNANIANFVPVIRVGEGAGAAQSFVNFNATNRRLFFENVDREGATPALLLAQVLANDPARETRQFGFASFGGPSVTFTGTQNFQTALGVTGQDGPYDYAIQGNILTGQNVIADCEAAFLSTPGDLAEKLMFAMEAARDAGGDGRCSCSASAPTSCGSPPPNFTYASLNGFMAIARPGDTDGTCNGSVGCANGDYYMSFNYIGNSSTQEPIANLRAQYWGWRGDLAGRADHVLSEVTATVPLLQADGLTTSRVSVRLVDVDGTGLTIGGQSLTVTLEGGSAVANVSGIVDNGDGTHSFDLVATNAVGVGRFAITVDDGVRPVRLHPALEVRSALPTPLHIGQATYSATEGTTLPLIANFAGLGAGAGAGYVVLGSLTGTSPGTPFGGTTVPLVADRFFTFTAGWAGGSPLSGARGNLDANERATALLEVRPGGLSALVGNSMHFAAYANGASGPVATPPASILIGL